MSSINNIDELLKNTLGHLEQAPPPDAWSGIQQGLSNVPTTGAESVATKSAVTAVKSVSVITKIIIAAATATVIAGGYIAYTYYNNTPTKQDVITTTLPPNQELIEQGEEQEKIEPKIEEGEKEITPSSSKKENKLSNTNSLNNNLEDKQKSKIESSSPSTMVMKDANNVIVKDETSAPSPDNRVPEKREANASKNEVKTIAKPKPKHNFSDEEKSTGSTSSAFMEDDQEQKPVIPNVFTPNNDGDNDKFKIEIEKEIFYELKVYDKDGKVVFESNSKENLWDGTNHNLGEPCAVGNYRYVFKYQYLNGKANALSGVIMLLKN